MDEYVEKVRNRLNKVRECANDAIGWHTIHLERIEKQMDPKYDPDLEHDDKQERLVREAKFDYIFLDGWKCIVDHANDMSSVLDEDRSEDS